MNNQLIFEIGTEEMPAGYLLPALRELKENIVQGLADLRLTSREINGAVTPRRLVVCVEDLLARQPDRTEEILGPPKKAAFDPAGKPTKAAIGFAKSRGVRIADIKIAATPKGEYLLICQEQKGCPTEELMVAFLPELLQSISFPKSMHWGESRTGFARPIQWLLALYNGRVIPFTVDGVGDSADVTYGHRFMAPSVIKVKDYQQYLNDLRTGYVLADPQERKEAVLKEIHRVAQKSGGHILPDDDLVATVANLVESPHAILGVFEEKFLALPKDALITSMREHQKYFAIVDEDGRLRPNFIAVNNTQVKDEGLGAEGHQRVLRARLEDGLFFFRKDLQRKLAERVKDLDGLIFQARLGSMREKTDRIQALAGRLAQELAPDTVADARRAAYLAKADLLTEMVNEFPSLQGLMGRDYAALDGEKPAVAEAIAEHYMPIRAGSCLPTGILGALIGIADRLDTIAGCFGIGQKPSGAADPFGLRRQALGLIRILADRGFNLSINRIMATAIKLYGDKLTACDTAQEEAVNFIKGRFVNEQTGRNIPAETVEAVVSVDFDDIEDSRCRIEALHAASHQASFPLLAGSFKRVMNIVKGHRGADPAQALLVVAEEKQLYDCYQRISQEVMPLLEGNNYPAAMGIILKMKEPIDVFFDKVMVMDDDPAIRSNRLSLLAAIADLFLRVGDFSKMAVG